jgi:uncharacterized membrane protein
MENNDNKIMYIVAYIIPLLTGIIVYVLYGNTDKKLKFQSIQAVLLGICFIIASVIFGIMDAFVIEAGTGILRIISGLFDLALLLAWLYGMYTGYKASKGMEANIPFISDYASNLSK